VRRKKSASPGEWEKEQICNDSTREKGKREGERFKLALWPGGRKRKNRTSRQ